MERTPTYILNTVIPTNLCPTPTNVLISIYQSTWVTQNYSQLAPTTFPHMRTIGDRFFNERRRRREAGSFPATSNAISYSKSFFLVQSQLFIFRSSDRSRLSLSLSDRLRRQNFIRKRRQTLEEKTHRRIIRVSFTSTSFPFLSPTSICPSAKNDERKMRRLFSSRFSS